MSPFTPRGDRSLRVIVTELAAAATYGEVLTFERLGEALNVDPATGRNQIRQAVGTARPGLMKRYNRQLVADRGVGYRVARPGEFAGIAENYREQGQRKIARALAVIDHAPEADMTPAELRRHRATGLVLHSLNERVNNTEQLLTDARSRLASLEDAVYGPPPPTIPGAAEPAQERPAPGGLVSLEDSLFRRGTT